MSVIYLLFFYNLRYLFGSRKGVLLSPDPGSKTMRLPSIPSTTSTCKCEWYNLGHRNINIIVSFFFQLNGIVTVLSKIQKGIISKYVCTCSDIVLNEYKSLELVVGLNYYNNKEQ